MDALSSLPLKKRPLRYNFACIEELAVSHSLSSRDMDSSSSGRSSVSSLDLEKESVNCFPGERAQPSSSDLFYRMDSFSLLCDAGHYGHQERFITMQAPKCFLSPSPSVSRDSGHTFAIKEHTNSTISCDISPAKTEASFSSSSGSPPPSIYCSPCKKHLFGRAKYQAHVRRHNSKLSGRYQCPDCGKRFVQRSSLVTHVRIHTGEKPYKCDFNSCKECFSDYSTYTKHIRTHTGEKPYTCPVCSRAFSQSGNMHRHLKGVHKHI